MSYTRSRFGDIFNDIKSSNYFRVWALFWIFFAIVSFICLIALGNRSREAAANPDIVFYFTNQSATTLPRFHFHTDGIDQITNFSCTFRQSPVPSGPCASFPGHPTPSLSTCIAVYGDQIQIPNDVPEQFGLGVDCNITTSGNDPQIGQMIGWNLDGHQGFFAGPDPRFSTWIHPTDNSFILLQKGVLHINGHQVDEWGRALQYFSSASTPGFFRVHTILLGFGQFNLQPKNIYTGWQAVGDIGGFAFFMVCLHTLAMIIIGIVFANTSSFLKSTNTSSQSARNEYSPVRE